MKIIAFSGSHCTMKTTLATKLYDTIIQDGYVCELGLSKERECPYPLNEDSTFLAQKWISDQILKMFKYKTKREVDFVVFDRSIWDTIGYAKWLLDNGKIMQDGFEEISNDIDEFNVNLDIGYHCVFLTTLLERLVYDGVRSRSRKYQEDIHELIVDVVTAKCRESGYMVQQLPKTTLEKKLIFSLGYTYRVV